MERLPVTPNGKIDRAALTMSYRPTFEQPEDLIPARTPAEELVARIWREVLGVERVGINSNFFNLGGHSLLATQMILRLREVFRIEVPVRSMFETPTVSSIVKVMSTLWGGREIVEEIAWTFLQLEPLSDEDANELLAQGGPYCQTGEALSAPVCAKE
jgi:acyl carrier protein